MIYENFKGREKECFPGGTIVGIVGCTFSTFAEINRMPDLCKVLWLIFLVILADIICHNSVIL